MEFLTGGDLMQGDLNCEIVERGQYSSQLVG